MEIHLEALMPSLLPALKLTPRMHILLLLMLNLPSQGTSVLLTCTQIWLSGELSMLGRPGGRSTLVEISREAGQSSVVCLCPQPHLRLHARWAQVLIQGFGELLHASSSYSRQPAGLCPPVACGSGRASSHKACRLCNGNNPTLPTKWGSRVLVKAGRA